LYKESLSMFCYDFVLFRSADTNSSHQADADKPGHIDVKGLGKNFTRRHADLYKAKDSKDMPASPNS